MPFLIHSNSASSISELFMSDYHTNNLADAIQQQPKKISTCLELVCTDTSVSGLVLLMITKVIRIKRESHSQDGDTCCNTVSS